MLAACRSRAACLTLLLVALLGNGLLPLLRGADAGKPPGKHPYPAGSQLHASSQRRGAPPQSSRPSTSAGRHPPASSGSHNSNPAAAARARARPPSSSSSPRPPGQRPVLGLGHRHSGIYQLPARRRVADTAPKVHLDAQVANRDARVWHGATENGP
jgi:hypothetical protein